MRASGMDRTTIWRWIKKNKLDIIKISAKKLWFLPPNLEITARKEKKTKQPHIAY